MKYLNPKLVYWGKKLDPLLQAAFLLRMPLLPLAWCMRRMRSGRPDFFVADGFLVGDTALIRPLLRAMERGSKKVSYMGGKHAAEILKDLPIEILLQQWPWASYQYGIKALFRFFLFWVRVFFLQPRICVEPRGDFRSIFCLFMACPEVLVGYSFSGGGRFLNREPKDMEHIAPLEEHHRRLGECLSLDYRLSDFFLSQKARVGSTGRKKVGLSFSGSLPLKCLPEEMALDLVSRLAQRGVELIYIAAPHDHFLAVSNAVTSGKITIWKGSFSEYFQLISGLDVYVGMDSGGAHLAAMNRIPSLLFYGTQVASYCRPPAYPEQTCWEPVSPLSCRPCPGRICVNSDKYQNCFHLMDRKAVVESLNRLIGEIA